MKPSGILSPITDSMGDFRRNIGSLFRSQWPVIIVAVLASCLPYLIAPHKSSASALMLFFGVLVQTYCSFSLALAASRAVSGQDFHFKDWKTVFKYALRSLAAAAIIAVPCAVAVLVCWSAAYDVARQMGGAGGALLLVVLWPIAILVLLIAWLFAPIALFYPTSLALGEPLSFLASLAAARRAYFRTLIILAVYTALLLIAFLLFWQTLGLLFVIMMAFGPLSLLLVLSLNSAINLLVLIYGFMFTARICKNFT